MTRKENIENMHDLALQFINSKDAGHLKKTVEKIVALANSFKYDTSAAAHKILIPKFANDLLANIKSIVDGSIDPSLDREIQDAFVIFKNIAELSIDT